MNPQSNIYIYICIYMNKEFNRCMNITFNTCMNPPSKYMYICMNQTFNTYIHIYTHIYAYMHEHNI